MAAWWVELARSYGQARIERPGRHENLHERLFTELRRGLAVPGGFAFFGRGDRRRGRIAALHRVARGDVRQQLWRAPRCTRYGPDDLRFTKGRLAERRRFLDYSVRDQWIAASGDASGRRRALGLRRRDDFRDPDRRSPPLATFIGAGRGGPASGQHRSPAVSARPAATGSGANALGGRRSTRRPTSQSPVGPQAGLGVDLVGHRPLAGGRAALDGRALRFRSWRNWQTRAASPGHVDRRCDPGWLPGRGDHDGPGGGGGADG